MSVSTVDTDDFDLFSLLDEEPPTPTGPTPAEAASHLSSEEVEALLSRVNVALAAAASGDTKAALRAQTDFSALADHLTALTAATPVEPNTESEPESLADQTPSAQRHAERDAIPAARTETITLLNPMVTPS